MVHKEEDEKASDRDMCVITVTSPPHQAQQQKSSIHQHSTQPAATSIHKKFACPRTGLFENWIPLSSFKQQNHLDPHQDPNLLPPFTFWIRPLCCHEEHGCDFKDICFVDRLCFPEDPQNVTEYCCEKMCFSKRSYGYAVIKDNRSEKQKWATTMFNHSKSLFQASSDQNCVGGGSKAISSIFSSICSRIGETPQEADMRKKKEMFDAEYNPDQIPVPPSPEQSSVIAYALVKVQKSDRCEKALSQPMCAMQKGTRPFGCQQGLCLDLQSVAVTPAYRKRGLAEFVIKKSIERAWNAGQELYRRSKYDVNAMEKYFDGEMSEEGPQEEKEQGANDDEYDDCDDEQNVKNNRHKKVTKQQHQDPFADLDRPPMNPFAMHVSLCVRRNNDRAIALYSKLGFVPEAQSIQQFYFDKVPMDRMGTMVDYS